MPHFVWFSNIVIPYIPVNRGQNSSQKCVGEGGSAHPDIRGRGGGRGRVGKWSNLQFSSWLRRSWWSWILQHSFAIIGVECMVVGWGWAFAHVCTVITVRRPIFIDPFIGHSFVIGVAGGGHGISISEREKGQNVEKWVMNPKTRSIWTLFMGSRILGEMLWWWMKCEENKLPNSVWIRKL